MKLNYDDNKKRLVIDFSSDEDLGRFTRGISCGAHFISNETCEDNMEREYLDKIERLLIRKNKYVKKVIDEWWGL